jgi:hypothetical protein
MQVANTLAYYDTAITTAVKSFIVQAPGLKFSVHMLMLNKKILKIGVIYKEVGVKKQAIVILNASDI